MESFIHSIFRTTRNFVNFSNFSNSTFLEFYKLVISRIFQIENLKKISNWNFLEFSKFKFPGNAQIRKWKNSEIFFNLENQSLAPKKGKFGIVHPFDIPHYSQFCQSSYLPIDKNQFRRFNFLIFISYSSENFLDSQIHKIIKFQKLFNFEN